MTVRACQLLILFILLTACATHRSQLAKNQFKVLNPCPTNGHTQGSCPGYVIDHIVPIACGGADAPENMQWQTIEDGKAKDKWERKDC